MALKVILQLLCNIYYLLTRFPYRENDVLSDAVLLNTKAYWNGDYYTLPIFSMISWSIASGVRFSKVLVRS